MILVGFPVLKTLPLTFGSFAGWKTTISSLPGFSGVRELLYVILIQINEKDNEHTYQRNLLEYRSWLVF